MPEIKLLTEAELRSCVSLDKQAIDIIDEAFATLAGGGVIMPPVLSMDLPEVNGEVDVKTAYVPGLDSFAIKVSPGFFNNPSLGLPSLNGLMIAFCAKTGLVKAVLLDNGYLTDVRTAAAGGVAARHLAPRETRTAGIIGTGVQARLQAKAVSIELDIEEFLIHGRNPEHSETCARDLEAELGIPVKIMDSARELVERSQLVVTTTPAREPVIQADWLHPGLHITAMGSDAPEKNELDPNILIRADRVVVDRISQSLERGEMRTAIQQGLINDSWLPDELGALCAGQRSGRESEQQITVCDLTGTGIQDTAIASHTTKVAEENGLGAAIQA